MLRCFTRAIGRLGSLRREVNVGPSYRAKFRMSDGAVITFAPVFHRELPVRLKMPGLPKGYLAVAQAVQFKLRTDAVEQQLRISWIRRERDEDQSVQHEYRERPQAMGRTIKVRRHSLGCE